jgi:hypothetical protein
MNKMYVATSTSLGLSRVYLTMFTPLFNQTISNLIIHSGPVSSPNYTLVKMGLFTISGTTATLVAETASDTTLFTAQRVVYTRALSSARGYPTSYSLVAGTRYALGAIAVGTGSSNFWSNAQLSDSTLSFTAPQISGIITSQTDLPTAATTYTAVNQSYFGRLS